MSAIPLDLRNAGRDPQKHDAVNRQGVGVGDPGEPSHTISTACVHGVAVVNMGGDKGGASVKTDGTCFTLSTNEPHAIAVDTYNQSITGQIAHTLRVSTDNGLQSTPHVIGAFQQCSGSPKAALSYRNETAPAITGGQDHQMCHTGMAVRRLTPRECERLQGFPDDHTLIPWRGKPAEQCPDGPRYKALGNSMAVPCMAWIGKRIAAQELSRAGVVLPLKEPMSVKLGNGNKRNSINADNGEPMFTLQAGAQHGVFVASAPLRYLSVCSGIEAASVAWEPLGWQPAAFAEVEKFPSAVLAHHWPQVPNMGDMTSHESWDLPAIDLLVGGTPCQSFSVAGLRKGLRDPRGGLMLTFLEIAQRRRPQWIVWENVPGVLSSHGGRDFGAFLGALGALGYGWAYRVLDAQWFGVAQRRRRVFVVGCLGDGAAAAKVLFESESVRRNPAPSREKGQRTAADASGGVGDGRWPADVAATLRRENGSPGYANQDIFAQGGANLVRHTMAYDCQNGAAIGDQVGALQTNPGGPAATSCGFAVLAPDTVGALTDGAHNGGGLTAKMPTRAAYSPSVANPLTARMGKGINTTLDEGQTPIVEGRNDL